MNDIAFFRKARMNPFDPATVTVNGDPSQLQQIDAENLLKAADDLTDGTYWAKSNITVTDDGDGVFDLMETAGTSAVRQYLTNWMPRWAARVSLYIEVLAGSLDTGIIYLQQNATGVVDEVEIISGPAQYSISTGGAHLSNLSTTVWSKVRVTGTIKNWVDAPGISMFPGTLGSEPDGSNIKVRNLQLVLGDQEKPRPVGAGVDDWMMAYRPHNRRIGSWPIITDTTEETEYDFEGDTPGSMPDGWEHLYGDTGMFEVFLGNWLGLNGVSTLREKIICTDVEAFDDGVVTGSFLRGSVAQELGVWMRHTGDTENDGYLFYIGTNYLACYAYVNGSNVGTVWSVSSLTVDPSITYNFRCETIGNTMRMWYGTGAWGGTWTGTGTDNNHSSGYVLLSNHATANAGRFDDIEIITGGRVETEQDLPGDGRYVVEDTEVAVSCGACSDILLAPASGSSTALPADGVTSFSFIYETGKLLIVSGRYVDSTELGYQAYVTGAGAFSVRHRVDGEAFVTDYNENGVFVDGVLYRIRIEANGTTVSFYVDDELKTTETLTGNLTVAIGYVYHDHVTAPAYITTESYPQAATGIIIPGGLAIQKYGDPGIWIAHSDGSAFSVDQGDAVLFTAKTFVASKVARLGLDNNTSASPANPYFFMTDNKLYCANAETFQPWVAGAELSFMQLLRSDTYGSQFFIHDSGSQWKRLNVNDDPIPTDAAFPAISCYSAGLYITNFALLDLSGVHDAEWCEVTDTTSAPAYGETFACEADHELSCSFTEEIGKFIILSTRYTDNNNRLGIEVSTTGQLKLYEFVGGAFNSLNTTAGVFADGVAYTIRLTAEDTAVRLFVNGVLIWAGDCDEALVDATGGVVSDQLVTNDIVLTMHPYPALGGTLGATDRVVHPQEGDTYNHESNLFSVIRGAVNGSTGTSGTQYIYRMVDDENRIIVQHRLLDGHLWLWEEVDNVVSQLISCGAGCITGTPQDLITVLDDAYGELLIDGVSRGSSSAVPFAGIQDGEFLLIEGGGNPESGEFWPLYVNLISV